MVNQQAADDYWADYDRCHPYSAEEVRAHALAHGQRITALLEEAHKAWIAWEQGRL